MPCSLYKNAIVELGYNDSKSCVIRTWNNRVSDTLGVPIQSNDGGGDDDDDAMWLI